MHSISGLARSAELPRRTLQYWVDHEVLLPMVSEGPVDAPKVFSRQELEVARMLRPFALLATPITGIKLLAHVIRDQVLDESMQSAEAMEEFRPLVAAARSGKRAYLVAQLDFISPEDEDKDTPQLTLFAATSAKSLTKIVEEQLSDRPRLPLITINVTEALDLRELGPKWSDGA